MKRQDDKGNVRVLFLPLIDDYVSQLKQENIVL